MNSVYTTASGIISCHRTSPELADRFAKLILFLVQNPASANYLAGKTPESTSYIEKMASRFLASRSTQSPSLPKTVPDGLIGLILAEYYNIAPQKIEDAIDMHMKAMSAENITGYLLECYIANTLESHGWIWCSGDFVKAVDFIKPLNAECTQWDLLQVKNRDNSENSSSAAIRSGTKIKKWFRTFSKTGNTNWNQFPDESIKGFLSENGFQSFVSQYLAGQ